ncbi:glucose PTS transporter transcription antiterminator GlcT [Laceyella putida]|uniref:Glucose PTS transporter transcription antiterminator GlcT n=1 Tax=Laceyella putida TaxID=110101 RepID=A0ABW2RJ07_9BACL
MSEPFRIKKILNNNVVIAVHPEWHEVVLIGKGIGFKKKVGELIQEETVEKCFVLKDKKEQEQYKQLLSQVDEQLVDVMNDVVLHIQKRFQTPLNEHIHTALMDHIGFAIKRLEQGIEFANPFLIETRALYEREYEVAEEIVDMIEIKLGVRLPESEVGFIAMHIHSALTRRHLAEIHQYSRLIIRLIHMVETALKRKVDRKSISYLRLVTHLRFAIERTVEEEEISEPEGFTDLLRTQYPVCYDIAWKLAKVMERELKKPVPLAEVSYLTLHLQRIASN